MSKSKYSTEEGRSISTSSLGKTNCKNNKHPFRCVSTLANSNLSCDRASQASRLREVLAGPIWRASRLLFFPEGNWNWSRTNIKPLALPVDNFRCAGSKQTTKSYHEEVRGTKSHNNNPLLSILTSSLWWFGFHRLLRAGGSLTSGAEGSCVARNPVKLPLSFFHVPAVGRLFLPRNLFGQARSQTRQLWRNRRLLLLQQAAGLLLQLLEDFFSFFSNETQSKKMCERESARGRVCSGGAKHCWPLQGRVEVNVGDIREEGNGRQIVNRAGQEVFLTAVFFHEGVCLAGVKEDLIRSHQQDTWNHTLGEKKNTLMSAQWKRITPV